MAVIIIRVISILPKRLKLSKSICEVGLLCIVIKLHIALKALFSGFSMLVVEESSTLSTKVNATNDKSKNKKTPVKIGTFGLFIIYKNAVATKIATTIIINTGLITISHTTLIILFIYNYTTNSQIIKHRFSKALQF